MADKIVINESNLLLDKAEGKGMKVDLTSPTYGWKDLIGLILPDTSNQNSPNATPIAGGSVRALAYDTGDKMDAVFHIPHDYAPGTDMFIHVHWMHNGTAISGNNVMTLAYTYAKGHQQAAFPAEKTQTITYDTVNVATTPQYRHLIPEIQLSNSGGTGNFLDTDSVEVDGVIIVSLVQTTKPTITGGTNSPFILTIDLHYQTTNAPTKQKSPNFYV